MAAIYNNIGDGYDTTRRADPKILTMFSKLLGVKSNGNYLDIACGTGNYIARLSRFGGQWFAFDQSETMLSAARAKSSAVDWRQCDAEKTGYPNEFFDAAMCSLAIHHFPDLARAFKEISRVLKSEGRLIIFTSTPEQMQHYWLFKYFPKMMSAACEQMPSLDLIKQAIAPHGFNVEQTISFYMARELKDCFLYSGKQKPEIYLSENIRRGISSFRKFCCESELQTGLDYLTNDIKSGEITKVIAGSENTLGDYLFVVVKKV